jgi:hypothetical protein
VIWRTPIYAEYKPFRNRLYQTFPDHNGPETDRFPGTKGRLVRLAQKLLDRSIFVFFCEDMGRVLDFPPQLLREFLTSRSRGQFFVRNDGDIWLRLKGLFTAMNDGTAFGGHQMDRFNGGLFAADPLLDILHIPNLIFCEQGQGQNDGSLYAHKETLLYLCAAYNYASGWTKGLARAPGGPQAPEAGREERRLGLYTLGRIFEQSITELEILEAEADGRISLNTESKRKRDGVYYTPERVVDRIVAETVGESLADLKIACGWPRLGTPDLPNQAAVRAYSEALREIKIVDPAFGSGAFLITTLRYLLDEWKALRDLRRGLFNEVAREEEDVVIAEILS